MQMQMQINQALLLSLLLLLPVFTKFGHNITIKDSGNKTIYPFRESTSS